MASNPPARINMNIDPDLKVKASELYESMGTNLTTAITMFLAQSIEEQGFPFKPTKKQAKIEFEDLPLRSQETILKSMAEIEAGNLVTVDDLRRDFEKVRQSWAQ